MWRSIASASLAFQSTRPARGATGSRGPRRHAVRVSIHAPRAGRDYAPTGDGPTAPGFNPRAPRGARPSRTYSASAFVLFQSTRPARGATPRARCRRPGGGVSIHAPRAGRDTSPPATAKQGQVSIHAPRAGRDLSAACRNLPPDVSIHAPRAGRDLFAPQQFFKLCSFNPRAPRGARLSVPSADTLRSSFNPRAPRGARHHTDRQVS